MQDVQPTKHQITFGGLMSSSDPHRLAAKTGERNKMEGERGKAEEWIGEGEEQGRLGRREGIEGKEGRWRREMDEGKGRVRAWFPLNLIPGFAPVGPIHNYGSGRVRNCVFPYTRHLARQM